MVKSMLLRFAFCYCRMYRMYLSVCAFNCVRMQSSKQRERESLCIPLIPLKLKHEKIAPPERSRKITFVTNWGNCAEGESNPEREREKEHKCDTERRCSVSLALSGGTICASSTWPYIKMHISKRVREWETKTISNLYILMPAQASLTPLWNKN